MELKDNCATPLESLTRWLRDENAGVRTAEHRNLTQHTADCGKCAETLAELRALRLATEELVSTEIAEQSKDTSWLDTLMSNMVFEARAGRAIPLRAEYTVDSFSVSEGALISAVRYAADQLEGIVIGRCQLVGNVENAEAKITVNATASAEFGIDALVAAQSLEHVIQKELERVAHLRPESINVVVGDFFEKSSA